ncbi:MAG: hypothetical protein AVDCRST_MAG37-1318 [uncultured Rubrobacteraceae bacterium]|uniref:Uncharacterized protein n=1 Tax=uncultured Rubrobacteraceae bacterium TaxID=349277 RepID=A0A6J4QKY4_9ACTN|nr:MAG: hypothetical protein AVDCRST_MAG37-1318 [uncultured Rubrobacteraceae bacterium]
MSSEIFRSVRREEIAWFLCPLDAPGNLFFVGRISRSFSPVLFKFKDANRIARELDG